MIFLVKSPKKKQEPIPFKKFIASIKDTFKNNWKWLFAIFLIGIILMFVLFAVLFFMSDILEKVYHIKDVKKGLLPCDSFRRIVYRFLYHRKINKRK